ncbi:MAG TPA: hypothetical protein PLE93_00725, partial [Solirubrobacterales bacterium]|nr:hypothetical protein [Solirubrobacterales bacterium]
MPAASGAAAKKKRVGPCSTLPINTKLSTHDPTGLLEDGYAWLYLNPKGTVRSPNVKVVRHGRVFARGRIVGSLVPGRTTLVKMHVGRRMQQGKYRIRVTASKPGRCSKRITKTRVWKFHRPTLGLKAIPVSTRIGDNVGVVRFALRPVRRTKVGWTRVSLIGPGGGVVSQQVIKSIGGKQILAELPIKGKLKPAKYR